MKKSFDTRGEEISKSEKEKSGNRGKSNERRIIRFPLSLNEQGCATPSPYYPPITAAIRIRDCRDDRVDGDGSEQSAGG